MALQGPETVIIDAFILISLNLLHMGLRFGYVANFVGVITHSFFNFILVWSLLVFIFCIYDLYVFQNQIWLSSKFKSTIKLAKIAWKYALYFFHFVVVVVEHYFIHFRLVLLMFQRMGLTLNPSTDTALK